MTILEALLASVNFPINTAKAEKCLIDRGLTAADTYSEETEAFLLAKADLIMVLLTTPSVSEGGFSLSLSDREDLRNIAATIYREYDEEPPFAPKPIIISRSDRW